MWLFAFAAAGVSATFSALVLRSWLVRRGPHLAAWGVALAMFSVASLAAALGMLLGWTTALFRTYYLFGAIVNVPVLAIGTVYLLAPRRAALVYAATVAVLIAGAVLDVARASLSTEALVTRGIPAGSEVMPEPVRTLSRIYSYVGFLIVAGGAIWSAARLLRQRAPHLRRLAGANGLIALGTTVVAVASGLARYHRGTFFSIGLLLGVTLMFVGFLRTRPRSSAP